MRAHIHITHRGNRTKTRTHPTQTTLLYIRIDQTCENLFISPFKNRLCIMLWNLRLYDGGLCLRGTFSVFFSFTPKSWKNYDLYIFVSPHIHTHARTPPAWYPYAKNRTKRLVKRINNRTVLLRATGTWWTYGDWLLFYYRQHIRFSSLSLSLSLSCPQLVRFYTLLPPKSCP